MENIFFECNTSFEGSMQHINYCLESAIICYTEELLTNHYVTEAVKETLWDRVKQFFTKLILSFRNFMKELETKIEYTIREKQIKHKLTSIRSELKEKKDSGIRNTEIVDYWSMKKIFKKNYDTVIAYAKKFSKVKYTKTWQIEDDLNDFNKLMEKINKELEDASNKKVKMSINKALDFVEDEIRGKSEILKTINDSIREFSEIEQLAENLKTKMNILGADVIPKHVGFIQKIVNTISAFIRGYVLICIPLI